VTDLSRKDLLRSVADFLRGVGEKVGAPPAVRPEMLLRPPGALTPDDAYLAACTGCEACVPACPYGAIFMAEAAEGTGTRVAVLAPARTPCHLCADLPCVPACIPGALRGPLAPRGVRMGVAQVDPRYCRTFRGEVCSLCVKACPLPDEAIRMLNGRPLVICDQCTGCGLCAAVCPDRPNALVVHPERSLMPGSRLPVIRPYSDRSLG
jgi:MauM/NapG family ferredoxin protein